MSTAVASPVARALLENRSLEMTARDAEAIAGAARSIPAGTRVNLTFLAQETPAQRIRAAQAILDTGLVPVPHLAARRLASEQDLRGYLECLEGIGAHREVFVVGGDPSTPEGPYPDALSVIRSGLLEAHGVEVAGIAGYPEGHPAIEDAVLRQALADKLSALGEQGLRTSVTSQFSFDPSRVARWIGGLRADGIDVPVRVGTPGPTGIKRLLGFARRMGIGANATMVKKYGLSLSSLIGNSTPELFIESTAEALRKTPTGDVALHFYTFGGLEAAAEWLAEYSGSSVRTEDGR